MIDKQKALSELHTALGFRRLNRAWGKCEIVIGLFAAGAGLFLGDRTVSQSSAEIEWGLLTAGLALFVFGGYLVLAGHRNHLYQSGNELTAYLAELIRSMNDKGKRE